MKPLSTLSLFVVIITIGGCAFSEVELPTDPTNGSDQMLPSPCVCNEIDYQGKTFQWIG